MHTITYTAPPLCGGSTTGTSTIEVTTAEPEIICQDTTVVLDATGIATIDYTDVIQNLLPGAYVVDQSGTFAPQDISSTGTPVGLGDDEISGALSIGFGFDFYGETYNDFYISSNGFVTFNATSCGNCFAQTMPTAGGVDKV